MTCEREIRTPGIYNPISPLSTLSTTALVNDLCIPFKRKRQVREYLEQEERIR
jgi:hypothetical protein